MWWPADRRKRHLLFSQLPKLLPSSNFMSVVNRGEMSAFDLHPTLPFHMFHTGFCSVLSFSICLSLPTIKVPKGKAVKVTFNKFLMSEPGQGKDCRKDYVEINGKK